MTTHKVEMVNKVKGRVVRNLHGVLVLFKDGVAEVNDRVARIAMGMTAYRVAEIPVAAVEPEPVAVVDEPVQVDEPVEDEPVVTEVEEAAVEENAAVEEEEPVYTKEQIEALYEAEGTWTAVAEALGVSVAKLRDIRKDVGLL